MAGKVSYTKEMRERAKRDKRQLCTIDIAVSKELKKGGLRYQGPFTESEVKQVLRLIHSILKSHTKKGGA